MPKSWTRLSSTHSGSFRAVYSRYQIPSGNGWEVSWSSEAEGDWMNCLATASASRVFPTPPAPVRLTRRCSWSKFKTSEGLQVDPNREPRVETDGFFLHQQEFGRANPIPSQRLAQEVNRAVEGILGLFEWRV